MKIFFAVLSILIFQTSAFAQKCCQGSCWRDGCCPPDYSCSMKPQKVKHITCFPAINEMEKDKIDERTSEVFLIKSGEYLSCIEE